MKKERIGLYAGTFDPFTIGHDSIVRRAAGLFDRLVIAVTGDNVHKPGMTPAKERVEAIRQLYADDSRIEVRDYYGLTIDVAHEVGAEYIVKGVRSAADLENERIQADINRQIGDVETILLLAEPQMQSISSTIVRELKHYGRDVSAFLPQKNNNKTAEKDG